LEPFLKPWWERAAPYKLFFQSRRQPVFLGKPRRKVALVAVVPPTHNLTVVILIKLFALVVIITMLAVTFSLHFSVTLGKCGIAGKHKDSQRAGETPILAGQLLEYREPDGTTICYPLGCVVLSTVSAAWPPSVTSRQLVFV
jgi:hypothetical protein